MNSPSNGPQFMRRRWGAAGDAFLRVSLPSQSDCSFAGTVA
jgi:hypothetical protein